MLEKTTHVFSPVLKLEHNAIIPELILKWDEKASGVLPYVQVFACVCVSVCV